ncbi:STAS/SEC14 domain-containing protein [Pseudooceanicola sp. HF7]|uniref:STAS/SEC14 domain-containing protein n=1 Tax=Pseudooceanicola sp. HF7 TaxID=2721560 RepID=UPI0014319E4D|nr:STAS/SEC14 domain-containing protein [Pseudooceanicola sp. HF7]NIZ11385.1 STAS/SEC14 domain-containing protein [Pseudooceanicola sp. HF7]
MIDIDLDIEKGILLATARGTVTGEDYETHLAPAVERMAAEHGKMRLLYWFGPEFEGFEASAMWSDMKLGLSHMSAFEKVAVVTDVHWLSASVQGMGWLIPVPVRVFANDAIGKANAWLIEDS